MAEQSRLLEKPRTRRVLQRVKVDSASLFVHRDSSSFKSKMTDNLSKMSVVFDFDPEVFSSGVYHRVFRGSLKHRLRQQQQGQRTGPAWQPVTQYTNYGKQSSTKAPTSEMSRTPDVLKIVKSGLVLNLSDNEDNSIIHAWKFTMLQDFLGFTKHLEPFIPDYGRPCREHQGGEPNCAITIRHMTHDAIALWRDPYIEGLYGGPLPPSAMQPWSAATSLPRQYHPMTLCKL
jgi:hypothetical protein